MATRKETPDVIDFNAAPEVDPNAHVLLKYTEAVPRVVAPFGELHLGEIAAAPAGILAQLLATEFFTPYDGPALDQAAVRHV